MTSKGSAVVLAEDSLSLVHAGVCHLAEDARVAQIVIFCPPGHFVSGVDVGIFQSRLIENAVNRILEFTQIAHSSLFSISRCPKSVTAFVDGPAFGGGLELALACHRIVAGPKAKFCFPETGLGIYPGMGGTQRLPRRVGVGLAKWMIYTGSIVPAEHALQLGLIDAVSSASNVEEALSALDWAAPRLTLEPRFRQLAEMFATRNVDDFLDASAPMPTDAPSVRALVQTRSAAPQALRLAERVIDRGITLPLEQGIQIELAHLAAVFATNDARTGLNAVGKPRPKFSGD